MTGFLYFWYDFLVGDAWGVALGVVVTLVAIGFLSYYAPTSTQLLGPLFAVVIMGLLTMSVMRVYNHKMRG